MTALDPFAVIADATGRGRRGERVGSYVALGDSFTAGRGTEPGQRWTDRLAASLRSHHPDLEYHNLAVDGATSADVLDQVGPALQLEPDLVTVICGANDVIWSVRPNLDAYGERLARIFDRLRGGLPRVAILTATSPERWRFLDLRPRTRARIVAGIGRLNEVTREVAGSRSVPVLDVVGHPGLDEPENFLDDGLHPSSTGHERAAVEFARALRQHFGIDSDVKEEEDR
jgi:lysophospholipase L1-like esterase